MIFGKRANGSPVESLSARELQIFELMGQGLSTLQIAEKLFLSTKTVYTYREHIQAKLTLSNGAELIRQAFLWALRPC